MYKIESKYKIAFTIMALIPTPLYIFLPYCKNDPMLSLLSLISISMTLYNIHWFKSGIPYLPLITAKPTSLSPLEIYLTPLNFLLAIVIALSGAKHFTGKAIDFIWAFPLLVVFLGVLLQKSVNDSYIGLRSLEKVKYPYKGA